MNLSSLLHSTLLLTGAQWNQSKCSKNKRFAALRNIYPLSLSYNLLFSSQPWFLFCTFSFCPDTLTVPWKGRKKELFCDRPSSRWSSTSTEIKHKEKIKTTESSCSVWITTSCSGTAGVVRSFLQSKVLQRSQNKGECVGPNVCWWGAQGNVGASLFGFSCVCI